MSHRWGDAGAHADGASDGAGRRTPALDEACATDLQTGAVFIFHHASRRSELLELINDCFSCHSTAAVGQGQLQLDKMTPGITCEGCHGAGEKHVLAMKARGEGRNRGEAAPESSDRQIFNPGRFDTEGLTQFCGACHRSWIQVQMLGIRGVENVRFQPYRIFKSKCYDHRDKRIGCTACHNPHEELVTDAAYYDAAPSRKAPGCPKARQDCASCHMPKIELPGAHYKFTDHRIRIARPGDPYPN